MDGILNIDKPAGISSAYAVAQVKRLLPRGVRIGHAGTLDPFATGVLLLLVGKATKLCETLMGQPKRYETVVKFGATTPTDDPDSPETPFPGAEGILAAETARPAPTRAEVAAVLPRFIGQVSQRPPAFSAIWVDGRRAYDLSRQGHAPDLPPRIVRIDAIEVLDYAWPLLSLRIDCGRGTYVRSIARDLGEALAVGGHLVSLRRTRVGDFDIADSVALARLGADGVHAHLHPAIGA